MNTDQKLRRLLNDAADSFDPPSLGPRKTFSQRRVVRIVAMAAGACLLVVALGAVIVGVRSGGRGSTSSGSSAASTAVGGGEAGSPASKQGADRPATSAGSGTAAAAPAPLAS